MLRNYLKIAWRNLVRKKVFSIINLAGLSVSVAFCLLLFFYIRHEQSYDNFHVKKDRLFRLEMTNLWTETQTEKKGLLPFLSKKDETKNTLIFPLVVGLDIQKTFPEIKSVTRFKYNGDQLVRANNEVFKESKIIFVDDNFLTNFSFPLLKGNPATVLKSTQNVVLSASTARKYFGTEDAVGKTIELVFDSAQLYTVSGIAKDAPENSSIQYSVIVPLLSDPDYNYNISERFNHSTHLAMVELAPHINEIQFQKKLNAWVKTYFAEYFGYFKDKDFSGFRWILRPLEDCHYSASTPWGHFTNARNIYQLTWLAIIILLIAALNYILLTISNAAARTQEIGVRKVMGAKRAWVIVQFWVETQLLVCFAVIAGLVIAALFMPLFNTALDTNLQLNLFSWKEIIPALITLCLLLGLIAGFYPAWLLSKMKPASIIKSFSTFKINPRFSKVMVVFQYTCCIILMIAAFVINRQMHFISNKDLGFDKEQVLIVKNPSWDADMTSRLRNRLSVYAQYQPSVRLYSAMNGGLDGGGNHNGFKLNGEQKWLTQLAVDYNYFEMLGLRFVAGRPFSKNIASDTIRKARACVVNETLFKLLGKDAQLGVYNETIRGTIIGVVKDYHFEDLSKKIEPQQHVLPGTYVGSFMFKISPGHMQQSIEGLKKEWKQITGNYPFDYTFLDQSIANMYQPEMRWQKTIQASAFFAILIACMGLFGLSAINAVNRTKEIGIRKVLGASVKDIVSSLSSGFLLLVAISILIAAPLAAWIMNHWLEDFAYRVTIHWWMLALVGVAALLIALATVSFQAIKAARMNPVNSLRSE